MMAGVKRAPKKPVSKSVAKQATVKKPVAAKKVAARKPAAAARPAAARKPAAAKKLATAKKAAPVADKKPMKFGPRADLGAPIDGFFAKQPAAIRPIVDALRALIDEIAPTATSSLKWGMPFYVLGDATLCAIGAHKAHVNLILSGPPGTYDDPDELLVGDGKTGRHLKLTTIDGLPHDAIRGWLSTARDRALSK